MHSMPYRIVLDASIFMWDRTDFEVRKNLYYKLSSDLPLLFDSIRKYQTNVLLSTKLLEEIWNNFPYNFFSYSETDFVRNTVAFLQDIGDRLMEYPEFPDKEVLSDPKLEKVYFVDNAKRELRFLLSSIHIAPMPEVAAISYEIFHPGAKSLRTYTQTDSVAHHLFLGEELSYQEYFESQKIRFVHNPKHDEYKSGGKIAKLSCYNETLENDEIPQALLDSAQFEDGRFYNFDLENNTYVVFPQTLGSVYHAYDENDRNKIPPRIRKIYGK